MLDIETFDNLRGGNVAYKALAHPLAAEALAALAGQAGRVAIFDPDGIAGPLLALCPDFAAKGMVEGVYVQDSRAIGQVRGGHVVRALADLPQARVASVLVAAFDAGRMLPQLEAVLPPGASLHTLDAVKIPDAMQTNKARYLDALNFATNFVFFRDDGHFSTRLTTANYWAGYGAQAVRFFCRLYDCAGGVLAQWEDCAPAGPGGVMLDSAMVRQRFGLGPFTGQLFIHALGIAGHDVMKYALDIYAADNGASLSCTHDANAWPSEWFAGLPAPRADEQVVLWLQNSHAVPIPAGTMTLDRMGAQTPVPIMQDIPPFATLPLEISSLFPGLHWPAQLELRAGRHLVHELLGRFAASRIHDE